VQDQQIAEIETLIVRTERAAQNGERLGTPQSSVPWTIPPAARMSRDALGRTANIDRGEIRQIEAILDRGRTASGRAGAAASLANRPRRAALWFFACSNHLDPRAPERQCPFWARL